MIKSKRKCLYLAAIKRNWKNRLTSEGMCISLAEVGGFHNPPYIECPYNWGKFNGNKSFPEFAMMHPEGTHSHHGWDLWAHVDNEIEIASLRQTILSFCIAMCD